MSKILDIIDFLKVSQRYAIYLSLEVMTLFDALVISGLLAAFTSQIAHKS